MNDKSNACTLNIKNHDALLIIPMFVICSFNVFSFGSIGGGNHQCGGGLVEEYFQLCCHRNMD